MTEYRINGKFLEEKIHESWYKRRTVIKEDFKEFDMVASKSGCVIDKHGRARHTIDCSCDDEYDNYKDSKEF